MTKHYVDIYYPGSFVANISTKEVKNRDGFTLPDGAYAYQFFDREEVNANGEVLTGKPKNKSKTYFKGKVFTLAEVKAQYPGERILISNMEGNEWEKVIHCGQGWQVFDMNAELITPTTPEP